MIVSKAIDSYLTELGFSTIKSEKDFVRYQLKINEKNSLLIHITKVALGIFSQTPDGNFTLADPYRIKSKKQLAFLLSANVSCNYFMRQKS